MSSEILVKVEGVSKKFCRSLKKSLWYGVHDIFSELNPLRRSQNGLFKASNSKVHTNNPQSAFHNSNGLRSDEFWAVNDVSFELRRGECLGLIGRNGAGKTTLLKMLNGLIKPDRGRIEMRGRVGALIALGAGFNPILTGRENIYVNGSVLGFSKREIDSKIDEIIDFAEIGDFIDAPVQSYSSGMAVRLGFAVASRMNPDIILIDEVLAVGDISFRLKCYNEIFALAKKAAVIFVSHSMSQVTKVCNRGLVLDSGSMALLTDVLAQAVEFYFNAVPSKRSAISGSGDTTLLAVSAHCSKGLQKLYSHNNEKLEDNVDADLSLAHGSNVTLTFDLKINPAIRRFHIIVSIEDIEARIVAQIFSANGQASFQNNDSGLHQVKAHIRHLPLNKGKYSVSILINEYLETSGLGAILASVQNAFRIQITSERLQFGVAPIQLTPTWQCSEARHNLSVYQVPRDENDLSGQNNHEYINVNVSTTI